jgi:hypothetical protein
MTEKPETKPETSDRVRLERVVRPILAYHVFAGDPQDGSLLVFAPTASKARMLGMKKGPWEWDFYTDTRARRARAWDGIFNEEKVIETNDELPKGTKPFYDDDWA